MVALDVRRDGYWVGGWANSFGFVHKKGRGCASKENSSHVAAQQIKLKCTIAKNMLLLGAGNGRKDITEVGERGHLVLRTGRTT